MYNSQDMEANYPSTDKWINKVWYLYAMGYDSAKKKKKKNDILHLQHDGPRNYHAKWSKSERDRLILYDITYMWILKNSTNESINKPETDL